MRILAQGLSDIAMSMEGGRTNVTDIFKLYIDSIFPWSKRVQEEQDQKMKAAMKREVQKGIITFQPVSDRFLKQKLKTMDLDDDFKKKIAEKRKAKR